ncbi:hypothetical protein D3C84_502060 [compost metagenome]
MLAGKDIGLVFVEFPVLGNSLVSQQGIAEVLSDVVFVGDQDGGDCRLVFVGEAGKGIYVGHVGFGEAFHGLLNGDVYIRVTLEAGVVLLIFWQLIEGKNVVLRHKGSLDVHVEPDINTFVFQALDPPVDFFQRLRAELLSVMREVALAKNVRADPG